MFSTEQLLRAVLDEREREIRAQLRVRRLMGSGRPPIRWFHRGARIVRHEGEMQRAR